MSTLLHVILDRAPALTTPAQECKGCPGTLCKGCHGTEHGGGCPYVVRGEHRRSGQNLPISHKIFPSRNRKNFAGAIFLSVRIGFYLCKWPLGSILSVESRRRKWPSACTSQIEVSSLGLSPAVFEVLVRGIDHFSWLALSR